MSRTKEQLDQRVLHLLNHATKPEELTYPKHYRDGRRIDGLPKPTAEALLRHRGEQARRAFSSIKDLELLSEDQLQTLRDAMDVPAAEFFLFKGFDEAGVLANAVSHADLPVVVNYGEQAVTIWTSQLLD